MISQEPWAAKAYEAICIFFAILVVGKVLLDRWTSR